MNGREVSCKKVQSLLPGFLDGGLPVESGRYSHAAIHEHVAACGDCREELSRYQKLQQFMAKTERVAPPAQLGLEIRMALARAREISSPAHWFRRLRDRAWLVRENILAPLALPATGGLVAALMVFSVVLPSYSRVGPMQTTLAGFSDDMSSSSFQPARLETLAGFPVSGLGDAGSSAGMVMVEATVDADGGVVDYRILAGPDNAKVRRTLDQILLLSRFHPQVSFGRPIAGGRVVMSFSTVNVKG
jgi:hypothetical protein